MKIVSKFLLIGLLFSSSSFAFQDATSVEFNFVKPPIRIITLSPALAELTAEFLGKDRTRLAGVSEYSDFPDWVKGVPSVGSFQRTNIEKVVSLRPDLVLATLDGNAADQVASLRRLGLKVLVIKTGTVDEWVESIRWIAEAIRGPGKPLSELEKLHRDLGVLDSRALQAKKSDAIKNHVYLVLGVDPWITVGKRSLLFQILTRAGFDLTFPASQSELAYPKYSREAVMTTHWDYVWIPRSMAGVTLSVEDRTQLERMGAKIVSVPGDELLRPSLRLLKAVMDLQEQYLNSSVVKGSHG